MNELVTYDRLLCTWTNEYCMVINVFPKNKLHKKKKKKWFKTNLLIFCSNTICRCYYRYSLCFWDWWIYISRGVCLSPINIFFVRGSKMWHIKWNSLVASCIRFVWKVRKFYIYNDDHLYLIWYNIQQLYVLKNWWYLTYIGILIQPLTKLH